VCVLWYCVPPFCSFPREGPSRADIITYASKEPARPKRDPTKAIWTCITAQQRHPHRDVFIHDSFDWPADQRSDWTLCGWIAESQKYHAPRMMCWPHSSRWNMKELSSFLFQKRKKKNFIKKSVRVSIPFCFQFSPPLYPSRITLKNSTPIPMAG
jgi:hypothetical protein